MRPPVDRTHDVSQTGYHVKDLRAFGETLTDAAAGAFPKGKSRYKEVHVLLLSWENDELGVMKEIDELRFLFDQTYRYNIEEWKIPSKRSHNSLVRRLTDFLEEYECRENLLLVYYGGHGHLNDDRQLTWSCTQWEDSPTVQWLGIQNMLEQAASDVLILLDCCAAATASAETGSGVTEVIAACGFETSAPGVCEHSFTRSLINELQYWSKRSPLSAAILHMKILSRMKYWKPRSVGSVVDEALILERRKTPVHTVLTNEGKPRSIILSPIEPMSTLSSNVPTSLKHSPSSDSSSQDVEMEDSADSCTTTYFPRSKGSVSSDPEQNCPTVLIAVALEENQCLQLDTWVEWLRDVPAVAKYARVEGVYESNSTLVLLSLPVYIWDLIPSDPAVNFVGFIKSQDMCKASLSGSSMIRLPQKTPSNSQGQQDDVDTAKLASDLKRNARRNTSRNISAQKSSSSPLGQFFEPPVVSDQCQEQKDRPSFRVGQGKKPNESQAPSMMSIMDKALRKAHRAVALDQQSDYVGALHAYEKSCFLLRKSRELNGSVEDREKLEALCNTYEARIGELREPITPGRSGKASAAHLSPSPRSVLVDPSYNDIPSLYSQTSQSATTSRSSTRSVRENERSLSGVTERSSMESLNTQRSHVEEEHPMFIFSIEDGQGSLRTATFPKTEEDPLLVQLLCFIHESPAFGD